jgi:hypothetical protein
VGKHRNVEAMERLVDVLERVVNFPTRVRHRLRARPRNKARRSAIAVAADTLRKAGDLKAEGSKTVWNVGLYLLFLDADLAQFTNDLVCAVGDRRRRFVAKHEAILLYEAAEDLRQLLGKGFRTALAGLGVQGGLLREVGGVSSDLNEFWRRHREFLGGIRNALAAHRDHDSLKYMDLLERVEPLEVMARAVEFSALLERLIRVLTEIALSRSDIGSILKDVIDSNRSARTGPE